MKFRLDVKVELIDDDEIYNDLFIENLLLKIATECMNSSIGKCESLQINSEDGVHGLSYNRGISSGTI